MVERAVRAHVCRIVMYEPMKAVGKHYTQGVEMACSGDLAWDILNGTEWAVQAQLPIGIVHSQVEEAIHELG